MAETYKGLLTNNGKALIASATLNNKIIYSHIAVGDGNGSVPNPLETRTALVNEKARIALNVVEINPNNTNQIICEAIIPSNLGGFYIRELGLYAGATMVVNASYPPTYKPLVDEGGAREIAIKLVINIQNAEVIALYLDDSLIYATRAWVDTNYIRRNELVDNLTTDDAKRPVSAKQAKNLQENKLDKTANAVSSSKLETARTVSFSGAATGSFNFDGSGNSSCILALANSGVVASTYGSTLKIPVLTVNAKGLITGVSEQNIPIVDDLSTDDGNKPLSARQGKKLQDEKFSKSGGQLSGKLKTKPSYLAQNLDDIGDGDNSPIRVPWQLIPPDMTGYIPFVHGSVLTDRYGYLTHVSMGAYRGSNTWDNSGVYIAVGGKDVAPTEAFMFLNGRKISNTAGPIDLAGNASSATKLATPRNIFGQTFDGSGDVGGTITASTGLIQASESHFIDMGRIGLDRMNFHNYGANFNFINTINGEVVARISGYGIDCNAASASKLKVPRKINNVDFDGTSDITVTDDALTYMPIPYPKSSPPTGYLAMMGQAISESTYPKLYALYGAVLPDMRAYSVRGLDYGRGIDVGRTVLSQQDDAIQNIKGSLKASSQYDRNTQFIDALVADGAFSVLAGDKSYTGEGSGWGQAWGTEFDASRVVRTSTETRIKNIAFLYIVKAG